MLWNAGATIQSIFSSLAVPLRMRNEEENLTKAAGLEGWDVQKLLKTLAPYPLLLKEQNIELAVTCGVLVGEKEITRKEKV